MNITLNCKRHNEGTIDPSGFYLALLVERHEQKEYSVNSDPNENRPPHPKLRCHFTL